MDIFIFGSLILGIIYVVWDFLLEWSASLRYLDLYLDITQVLHLEGDGYLFDYTVLYHKAYRIYHDYELGSRQLNLPNPEKLGPYVEFDNHYHTISVGL